MIRCTALAAGVLVAMIGCVPPVNMGPGETTTYSATLDGTQETPSVDTAASGSGTFTVDANVGTFTYEVTYSSLTGPVIAAHLHQAPIGVAGGVIVDLSDDFTGASGTASGSGSLTAAQLQALANVQVYINIHTAMHTDGEIRGQLVEAP